MMRTTEEDNCWGDSLSRWRRAGTDADGEVSGSAGCRNIAVLASADVAYALRSNSAIRKRRKLQEPAPEGPVENVAPPYGTARCDTEILFRMSQGVQQSKRTPAEDEPIRG